MDIKLYYNASLSNVVDKTLTLKVTTTSVKFLEPYDEYAPTIRYKGKWNFDDVNYLSVEQSGTGGFTRYYYIDNVTYRSPSIAIISCRLDVLKTYSTFIKSLQCYVTRTGRNDFIGSNIDFYIVDEKPERIYRTVDKFEFRDENKNIVGFVPPNTPTLTQEVNGVYVVSVIHDTYDDHTVHPDPI